MNVKIIVYSFSGNTLQVAKELQDALKNENIPTTLEEIKTTNEKEMDWQKVNLTKIPQATDATCYIFAAPVQAFRLVTVMSAYFHTITNLNQQPCFFFTTQFFPFDWMGGNQAKKMAREYISRKNGQLQEDAIIHWKKKNRSQITLQMIKRFVEKIKSL